MRISFLTLLAIAVMGVNSAQADTITASESFEVGPGGFTVGDVVGQGPTNPGFTGDFFSNGGNSLEVQATGLTFNDPLYIGSSGGALTTTGQGARNARLLADPFTNATNETVYLSFLLEIDDPGGANSYRAFELHDTTLGGGSNGLADSPNRQFALGTHQGDFGTGGFGFRAVNSTAFQGELAAARDTNTNLFVVRFDLSDQAGQDSVTAFFNPTLGGGDPVGEGVTVSGFDLTANTFTLGRFGGTDIQLDEVRFGDSFDAVTLAAVAAIPEPSSLGLLSAACLGIFVRRRRR